MRPRILLCATAFALLAAPALAEPAQPHPPAINMREDAAAWMADPHMHAFYDLTVQTFAQGADRVDEAAYTRKAFAIFRDFGAAQGVSPERMVDHLKLIPGQMVQIVRRDPTVLNSYDAFTVALVGPQ